MLAWVSAERNEAACGIRTRGKQGVGRQVSRPKERDDPLFMVDIHPFFWIMAEENRKKDFFPVPLQEHSAGSK